MISVILPDSTVSSGGGGGVDLEHQLMSHQSTPQLHGNGGTNGTGSVALPRYSGSDFMTSGPRSLSDSSTAESPVGNEDVLHTNGQTSFHHHHVHHHNTASSYPGSHYPVLPASLLYSQLYHSTGSDLLGSSASIPTRQPGDETDQRCVNSVVASQQRTHNASDHSAVWRPY